MKRNIILITLATLLLANCGYKKEPASSKQMGSKDNLPKNVRLIATTPIKDQGESDLCWAYAMLGTIESEHIMKGDSVNLSVAYIVRMMLQEKAVEYYLSQGKDCTSSKKNIDMRGMAPMLIHYIDKYGAQPYDSYEDPKDINYRVLCRKVENICDGAIARKAGLARLREELDDLFNQELGYMPAKLVHMLGAEYTPLEFAHSVCYPEEYVSLTSFTHHPYREYFALEVPDNKIHSPFLNLPLDELMLHIEKAVEHGHPVCWEGDITEKEFTNCEDNYVDVPQKQLPITASTRQKEFEQLRTTDDHAMEIIGTFMQGKQRYYVCRNSWGKNWGNQGRIYLSEDYLRLKTIAVYMSEAAFLYNGRQPL